MAYAVVTLTLRRPLLAQGLKAYVHILRNLDGNVDFRISLAHLDSANQELAYLIDVYHFVPQSLATYEQPHILIPSILTQFSRNDGFAGSHT